MTRAFGRKLVPDSLLRATEDPHLNLLLAVLNLVPVAQRTEWMTTNMPKTASLLGLEARVTTPVEPQDVGELVAVSA